MILIYRGTGETVPVLGGRYVAPGEAVSVRDKHVQGLLATGRWGYGTVNMDANGDITESAPDSVEIENPHIEIRDLTQEGDAQMGVAAISGTPVRGKRKKVAGGEPDATDETTGSTNSDEGVM